MIAAARQALTLLCVSAVIVSPAVAQNLASKVDSYLKQRPAGPFSGVILIARDGSVIFERAYGLADADLGVHNTVEMRFGIGSLTKPITATAVMRLVERGKLKLSDSICAYLARCPDAWRVVTVEHLLTHTSGIPDLFGEMPAAPVESTRAIMDNVIAKHLGDTLRSPPGDRIRPEAAQPHGRHERLREPSLALRRRYHDHRSQQPGERNRKGYGV